MSLRGSLTLECDRKGCYGELVLEAQDITIDEESRGLDLSVSAYGWHVDDDGDLWCESCCAERDEDYERAAARARNNDFAETGGKDWT